MPADQQIAGVGILRSGLAKEAVAYRQIPLYAVLFTGRNPGSCSVIGNGIQFFQCLQAIAVAHKQTGILELGIGIFSAGENAGKGRIPFDGNTGTLCHFSAHSKGQHNRGCFGIHRSLTGQTHGHAGNALGGIATCPTQPLHRLHRPGKHRQGFLVHQAFKALGCLGGQGFEITKGHIALFIPADLVCQSIDLIPVIDRCALQFGDGIVRFLQSDILGQRAGKFIQTVQACVQKDHGRHDGADPTAPADGIPFQNDHQNCGCQNHRDQGQQQHLPYAEIHATAPPGQKHLCHSGHIGIDHIHQHRMGLGKFPQRPSAGQQYARCQVSSPIFQKATPPLFLIWNI